MYFDYYYNLNLRSFVISFSFQQFDWDLLLKPSILSLNVDSNERFLDKFYLTINVFDVTSNLAFAYINRFFNALTLASPRFNLNLTSLKSSGNSLSSITYLLRGFDKNLLLYILIFILQYKGDVTQVLAPVMLGIDSASVYFKIFNSFYVKPVYDFGDLEWAARLRLIFRFNYKIADKVFINYILSFLKILF